MPRAFRRVSLDLRLGGGADDVRTVAGIQRVEDHARRRPLVDERDVGVTEVAEPSGDGQADDDG
jgi:hypothetical protein